MIASVLSRRFSPSTLRHGSPRHMSVSRTAQRSVMSSRSGERQHVRGDTRGSLSKPPRHRLRFPFIRRGGQRQQAGPADSACTHDSGKCVWAAAWSRTALLVNMHGCVWLFRQARMVRSQAPGSVNLVVQGWRYGILRVWPFGLSRPFRHSTKPLWWCGCAGCYDGAKYRACESPARVETCNSQY